MAFGLAAGSVVFNPAANSVLPSIVDDDELVAANAGLWSAARSSPRSRWGPWPAPGRHGGWRLRCCSTRPASPPPRCCWPACACRAANTTAAGLWLAHTGEGAQLVSTDRLLRLLALVQLLAALSAGATSALLGVPGRPKCWWIAHRAMNSGWELEVICGPLSLKASSTGRAGSSTVGSTRPSWRAVTPPPAAPRAPARQ